MKRNILAGIPGEMAEEKAEVLAGGQSARVERIISRGHASPEGFWYDQPLAEWVMVVSGAAQLLFDDGEKVEMTAGDHVTIPPHRKHRVEWTDPSYDTVWIAVHYEG